MSTPSGHPDPIAALIESARTSLARWQAAQAAELAARSRYEGLIDGTRERLRETWSEAKEKSGRAQREAWSAASIARNALWEVAETKERTAADAVHALLDIPGAAPLGLAEAIGDLRLNAGKGRELDKRASDYFRVWAERIQEIVKKTRKKSWNEVEQEFPKPLPVEVEEAYRLLKIERGTLLHRVEELLKPDPADDLRREQAIRLVGRAREARRKANDAVIELISPFGAAPLNQETPDLGFLAQGRSSPGE